MNNSSLRRTLRQQRRQLNAHTRHHMAFLASLHLVKLLPHLPRHAKIGLYLDGFGELPTLPILAFCQRYGFRPYLPITKAGEPLRFAPCYPNLAKTPLKTHPLGMQEPRTHAITAHKLHVIICPLVAVDRQGNRLGMGGGFYDRTFARTPHTLKVGWGYHFQWVDKLSVSPWDKGIDMFISEKGLVRF
ncbi:MAG: 5-formyltetrahydrofolate cyclo-ligase [Moraxella sp.]|nr:5-formyltetrahydrofolate cyclo-ligase [Moraxella sp.]